VAGGVVFVGGLKALVNNGEGDLTIGNNVTLKLSDGFDCGQSSGNRLTIFANGSTLQISSGGFIDNNSPIYQSGATLNYNTGGPFGVGLEWAGNSTIAGYEVPHHVTITGGTTVICPTVIVGLLVT
jgi:hypothetical protein